MSLTPAVCIMIPTYNQAGYIVKAVESALAQDYPNKEIIIADDNSGDGTAAILRPYIETNQVRYIKNKENLGRVENYRRSLYEGTAAEWVINLDGDDYFVNPQFISQAMHAIQEAGANNILFYQGAHIYLHNGKEELQVPRIHKKELLITTTDYFFGYFTYRHFSHMSTLYNRRLAMKSGFYEKDVISSDIQSILQLCLGYADKKVIISKNVSGIWLQHESNSSKTVHINRHWNNFKVFKDLYRQALQKGFSKVHCFQWLMKARYIYLRTYAGTFMRKIKQ